MDGREKSIGSHRLLKVLLAASIFLIGGEMASRTFWSFYKKTPFLSPNVIWHSFYPAVRDSKVEELAISNQDDVYDVLVLSGSALHDGYGSVGPRLKKGLEERLGKQVRLVNLSFPAHNSRDSRIKHKRLTNQRFDLVVVYHGINETRMNCVPEGEFRDDYSHSKWYENLDFIDRHPTLNRLALPFTLYFSYGRILEVTGLASSTSRHNPAGETAELGKNIRTRKPFQDNIETIVNTARSRGERVVLMTYAYHVPEGFSLEGDQDKHSDYASGSSCFALWGKPRHVTAAIDQHNEAVRELALRHPDMYFVDQRARLGRSRNEFYDCCHLAPGGSKQFVENILDVVAGRGGAPVNATPLREEVP